MPPQPSSSHRSRNFVFEGSLSPISAPAHFGTPVPDFPSRWNDDVSAEEMQEAIKKHCDTSSRQLDQFLQQITPEQRTVFIERHKQRLLPK